MLCIFDGGRRNQRESPPVGSQTTRGICKIGVWMGWMGSMKAPSMRYAYHRDSDVLLGIAQAYRITPLGPLAHISFVFTRRSLFLPAQTISSSSRAKKIQCGRLAVASIGWPSVPDVRCMRRPTSLNVPGQRLRNGPAVRTATSPSCHHHRVLLPRPAAKRHCSAVRAIYRNIPASATITRSTRGHRFWNFDTRDWRL